MRPGRAVFCRVEISASLQFTRRQYGGVRWTPVCRKSLRRFAYAQILEQEKREKLSPAHTVAAVRPQGSSRVTTSLTLTLFSTRRKNRRERSLMQELVIRLRALAYQRSHLSAEEKRLLLTSIKEKLKNMQVSDAATVAWALARLNLQDDAILKQILELAISQCSNMDHRSLSQMLWGIGKFGRRPGIASESWCRENITKAKR